MEIINILIYKQNIVKAYNKFFYFFLQRHITKLFMNSTYFSLPAYKINIK